MFAPIILWYEYKRQVKDTFEISTRDINSKIAAVWEPTEIHRVVYNNIQTFNADFTTAHIEHTGREGMAEFYTGEGARWAREIKVEWKGG